MDGTDHSEITTDVLLISAKLSFVEYSSSAHAAAQVDALTRPSEHLRRSIARAILSRRYSNLMNFIVILNLVVVVLEADRGSHLRSIERSNGKVQPTSMDMVIHVTNRAFLVIYCIDVLLHMCVYRFLYFSDSMRKFDLSVVSLDLVAWLLEGFLTNLPSASVLRVARLAKLVRAAKLVSGIQELYMIISGFVGAMRALLFGMIVLAVLLLFWSVVCVEVIQVYVKELQEMGEYASCSRCPRAFDSVGDAILTLIQTTFVGDSWGEITIPIIEYRSWTAIPLLLAYGTVNLAVLNLILSAVVESANNRRDEDKEHQVLHKIREAAAAKDKLKRICKQMDVDESSTLTYEEIVQGYEDNRDFFATMELLDVGKDEMHIICKILDADNSGSVTHDEFVNTLHKMATEESHSILVSVKHSIVEMQQKLNLQISALKDEFLVMKQINEAVQKLSGRSDFPDRDMRKVASLAPLLADMGISSHDRQSPELQGRFDPRCWDLQTSPEAFAADRSHACAMAPYARMEAPCRGREYSIHTDGRKCLAAGSRRLYASL